MKHKNEEPDRLKSCTLEEIKDQLIGKEGTPDRDAYERQLQRDLMATTRRRTWKRRWTT